MPGKLVAVLCLCVVSMMLNIILGQSLEFAIQLGCFVGLLKGNDVVRKIVIFFNCLGLALVAVGAMALLSMTPRLGGTAVVVLGGAVLLFDSVSLVFTIWALSRADVKRWMLHRGTQSLEPYLDGPTPF